MANIPALPTPGTKPWNLNPHITAMNAELNGRLSETGLSNTIGAQIEGSTYLDDTYAANTSMYIVGDGDSITQASVDSIARIFADSWYTYFTALSDGRLPYVFNAGHGGYSSAQLVALLDAEVKANLPATGGVVIWAAGRNDSRDVEKTKAGDRAVLAWCRANRVRMIVTTIPPVGTLGLATPSAPNGVADTASGTLAAGTYAYKIVAKTDNDSKVTLPGPPTSVTVSATGRVVLTWTHVPGATGYDIYRDNLKIGSAAKMNNPAYPFPTFTDSGAAGAGAPPTTNTTAVAALDPADVLHTARVNAWRKRFAATNGLQCVDFYRVMADPATGRYKQGYSIDGTHPSSLGQKIMGQEAWDTLGGSLPQVRGYIAEDQADPLNGYTNGLFLTGAGNPVDRPSPFNGYGTPAVVAGSIAPLAGFKGNAWVLDRQDPTKGAYNGANVINLAGFASVGDRVQFSTKIQKTGSQVGGMIAEIGVRWNGVSPFSYLGFWRLTQDVENPTQLVSPVGVVPASATGFYFIINVFGGTGKLALGQMTLLNLTTGGSADV